MAVPSTDLARALASRLDAVAPAGLSVRAIGAQIGVHRGTRLLGGSAAPEMLADGTDDVHVVLAARSTLGAVQGVFAHELTAPWPAPEGALPALGARVEGGVLLLWFGAEERPALSLAPFELPAR